MSSIQNAIKLRSRIMNDLSYINNPKILSAIESANRIESQFLKYEDLIKIPNFNNNIPKIYNNTMSVYRHIPKMSPGDVFCKATGCILSTASGFLDNPNFLNSVNIEKEEIEEIKESISTKKSLSFEQACQLFYFITTLIQLITPFLPNLQLQSIYESIDTFGNEFNSYYSRALEYFESTEQYQEEHLSLEREQLNVQNKALEVLEDIRDNSNDNCNCNQDTVQ